MRLYPKELNSLKELEQEKKKLKKQLEALEEEEIFSMSALMPGKAKKNDDNTSSGFNIASLISLLPISNPLIAPVIGLIQRRLFSRAEKKAKKIEAHNYVSAEPYHEPVAHKVKKAAKSVAFELITGYLKWKAIELTYKGARHIIKTQRDKRKAATM